MIGAIFQRFGAEAGMVPMAAHDGGDGAFLREVLRQAEGDPGPGGDPDSAGAEALPEAAPGEIAEPVPGEVVVSGDSDATAMTIPMGEGGPLGPLDSGLPVAPLAGGETARAGPQAPAEAPSARAGPALSAAADVLPPVARPEGAPVTAPEGAPADAAPVPVAAAPPAPAAITPLPPRFAPAPPPLPLRLIADAAVTATGRTVELRLWPEELGVLRMTLAPEGDSIRVAILAERAETFELLRRHGADLVAEFRALGFGGVRFSFGQGGGQEGRGQPAGEAAETGPAGGAPVPGTVTGPVTVAGLDLRI